ncbi:MAG: hypothetical protein ABSH03_06625 [Candidatus Lustribacter sp.]|jgi:hypothetical protein
MALYGSSTKRAVLQSTPFLSSHAQIAIWPSAPTVLTPNVLPAKSLTDFAVDVFATTKPAVGSELV